MHSVTRHRSIRHAHRMKVAGREDRIDRADRMTAGDCPVFDIHDIFRQARLAHNCDHNRREGLIDFDTIDVCNRPTGAFKCQTGGGDKPQTDEQSRIDAPMP
jgi:hypothetical protein